MATIKILEDLQKAYEDYPHVYLELEIIEVDVPGNVLDTQEVATYRIRATNRGPVSMNNVGLRVTGLNGTQVKANGAAAPWGSSFDIPGEYFGNIPGHNGGNPVVSQGSKYSFKPTSASTVARDLFRVEVTGWEADSTRHLDTGHTRADPEAKVIYSSAVSAA